MRFKLLGISHYDFEDKGNKIVGNKLHCLNEDETKQNLIGHEVTVFSANDEMVSRMLNGTQAEGVINRYIDVEFNQYGKPAKISLIK